MPINEIWTTSYFFKGRKNYFLLRCSTEILNENPNDGASKLYLLRCQKNQQIGIPEDWDGIEVMNTK